jgi:hypothetical protein
MSLRMTGRMDIWMSSKSKAIVFGSNYANVVVVENGISSSVSANAISQPIADVGK